MSANKATFSLIALVATALAAACANAPECPPPTSPSATGPQSSSASPPQSAVAAALSQGRVSTVVRQVNHVIEFGPYSVEVDSADGGRIVAFSLDGRSVVAPRTESPEAYGSSIWPSPQSAWTWPPPPALDKLPWQTQVVGSALVLESGTDDKLQLASVQRIAADPQRKLLHIDVTLINRGTAMLRVAPWQNTRVRPNGLTFYPSSRPAFDRSSLKLSPEAGIVWFRHDPAEHPESVKLYADGEEGWVAHVDGDLVLIKTFPDVPESRQAPEEGEIVIYVAGNGLFVEVEQQGPYEALAPGASMTWPVRWILRRVPPGVAVEPGNKKLVEFVREAVSAANQ